MEWFPTNKIKRYYLLNHFNNILILPESFCHWNLWSAIEYMTTVFDCNNALPLFLFTLPKTFANTQLYYKANIAATTYMSTLWFPSGKYTEYIKAAINLSNFDTILSCTSNIFKIIVLNLGTISLKFRSSCYSTNLPNQEPFYF